MKRIVLYCVIMAFLLNVTVFSADPGRHDITGVVRDAKSGEALPHANVMILGTDRGATTNKNGYFVLVNEPVGPCTLLVKYIGYVPKSVSTENRIGADKPLQIALDQTVLMGEAVSVTAQQEILEIPHSEFSEITLSPQLVTSLPRIGDVDVFRTLQLLPGISAANDGESGLYVRGGTPDQNLVLFDGMTIYHVDHFFGFFSAFNADAIKDIQVFKGGFPAEYGGRLSSVINMTGKTGNQTRVKGGFGINLLSTHGYLEVPIFGKGTLLVAGRRSYTDFLRSSLYESIYKITTGEKSGTAQSNMGPQVNSREQQGNMQAAEFQPSFYFYDFNNKLTLNPSSKDILTFSLYSGKDNLDKSQDYSDVSMQDRDTQVSTTLNTTDLNRWGNFGVSGGWARQWNSRLHTDVLVAQSKYFSTYDRSNVLSASVASLEDSTYSNVGFTNASLEDNQVKDKTIRFDVLWNVGRFNILKFGSWISKFDSKYTYTLNDTIALLDRHDTSNYSAFYFQDQFQLGKNECTTGIRLSHYEKTDHWYFEPRIAATVSLSEKISIKASWGTYYQFVNRIINENILEGSRDFWILSGGRLKPSFSEHRILGLRYETTNWYFSVEGYHKPMWHLVEFTRRLTRQSEEDSTDFFYLGKGLAKGLEFLVQKKRGKVSGWVGYTLGKVENTYSVFNDGDPFPGDNDRRHEVTAVSKCELGAWTFSATCVFATGKAYTAPESQYVLTMLNGERISYIHVGDKNGERLPEYFRLDLSVSRKFEFSLYNIEIGLTVFNTTNHKNVWYREYNLATVPVTVSDALTLGVTPTLYLELQVK